MNDLISINQAQEVKIGSIEDVGLESINTSTFSPLEHYKKLTYHKLILKANREYKKYPSRFGEGKLVVSFEIYPDGHLGGILLQSQESNPKLFELVKKIIESANPLMIPPMEFFWG